MGNELYIIDGSAYIYRAYHAVAPLTNSHGQYTHAVYGFINIMRRLIKDKSPSRMLMAYDSRGPVFRHDMYPEYKANRPPMPDDLVTQIPYIKEYVKGANIPSLEVPGVEADDIIATAALKYSKAGLKVIIVSGDKDLLQLIDENITVWDPMKNKVMDAKAVQEKYSLPPTSLLDCFALMGDSADNVPGVPGVGPKTAQKLIAEYGSLDGLYEQIEGLKKSKMKEKLIDNKDGAYLSKDLIRLKVDVQVPDDPDHFLLTEPHDDILRKLYEELEFTTLLKEVEVFEKVPTKGFELVTTHGELHALVEVIKDCKIVAIDTETTSLNSRVADLVGVSIAIDLERAWYIPVGHKTQDGEVLSGQLSKDLVIDALKPIISSKEIAKVGHNLKYDYTVLKNSSGVLLDGYLIDTMLAVYLLDPTRRVLKLDDLCKELGVELTSFDTVVDGDKREDCFAYVSLENACNYACEDVYGALLLWREYEPKLVEMNLNSLFKDVEAPLIPILAGMENAGIALDSEYLSTLAIEFLGKLNLLEAEIHQLAGTVFNINSPSQLGKILFEDLELPHGRKTKTGYSTDIKVLEKLAPKHELPAKVIQYRTLSKLQSTYVEKLGSLVDLKSGRVHTSFNQAITATGRLSSSNPNMQNIPIRSEDGNRIRKAFVPAEGMMFLSADYSQIDLRVLAHYSQDEALLKAFRAGTDIHARTAAQIFSVSELLITPEMRRVAKSINFGIVYGMSAFGLAKQLGITRKDAQQFIDRYFAHYSGVKTFMENVVEQAKVDGFVTTLLQRRRAVPEINVKNKTRREFAERIAINTPIQGTAADIIKLAMLSVSKEIKTKGLKAKLLLQVHDELVFELPESELVETKAVVKIAMEDALTLDVPLVANFEEGGNLAK